jgi:hypothetical protein
MKNGTSGNDPGNQQALQHGQGHPGSG